MFKKLAEKNNADAQFYLGVMYAYGSGVVKNDTQAVYGIAKLRSKGSLKHSTTWVGCMALVLEWSKMMPNL